MPEPRPDRDRLGRAWTAGYPLRLLLLYAALAAIAARYAAKLLRSGPGGGDELLLALIGQLDVYRALCYAALPAMLIVIFAPARRSGAFARPRTLLCLSLGLGALCAALIWFAPLLTRPQAQRGIGALLSCCYVAANVSLLIWLHCGGMWTQRLRALTVRCVGFSDLLLPAVLWSARERGGLLWAAARPLCAALIGLACLLPWVLQPLPVDDPLRLGPQFQRLRGGAHYQAAIDPVEGTLVLTHADGRVTQLDPRNPAVATSAQVGADYVLSLARDQASGRWVYVDPAGGQTLVFGPAADSRPLRIVIEPPDVPWTNCRSLWNPERQELAAACFGGALRLCADGETVVARCGAISLVDALLHPTRPELHAALISPRGLAIFDSRTIELLRFVGLRQVPERMLLDAATDRLIVSLPIAGSLLLVDAAGQGEPELVRAFPGVREMAIDERARLLYLAGLSPLIEVRSLDDFSLIGRVHAPSWARWLSIDPQRNAAYLATGRGLWRVDLDYLTTGGLRYDPFYALAGALGSLLARLSTIGRSPVQSPQLEPVIYDPQGCAGPPWTALSLDTPPDQAGIFDPTPFSAQSDP
ncbi:MAG: hypothetical protein P9M14_07775 [Candidatus Alcyoniella australis]|nr:hypothetical protein [Candidatus Alcyoniella australis]